MNTVRLEPKGNIVVLHLDNGLTNPVSPALVNDLHKSLDEIAEQARGLVLCGGQKFFSIGLDLPQLLDLDKDEMRRFWHKFNSLVLKLFTLPIPTACAVEGHAPGAGAILALTCDFRFISEDKALIGFNEIQLNIPAPYLATIMLRQALGQPDADELLFAGNLITAQKANEISFASEILPKSDVKNRAIEKIKHIAGFSQEAFAASKAVKTENIQARFEENHVARHEIFLENWFSDTGQAALKDALKKF